MKTIKVSLANLGIVLGAIALLSEISIASEYERLLLFSREVGNNFEEQVTIIKRDPNAKLNENLFTNLKKLVNLVKPLEKQHKDRFNSFLSDVDSIDFWGAWFEIWTNIPALDIVIQNAEWCKFMYLFVSILTGKEEQEAAASIFKDFCKRLKNN